MEAVTLAVAAVAAGWAAAKLNRLNLDGSPCYCGPDVVCVISRIDEDDQRASNKSGRALLVAAALLVVLWTLLVFMAE